MDLRHPRAEVRVAIQKVLDSCKGRIYHAFIRRGFLLLLSLLPVFVFGQNSKAPVITVLDFQASGISSGEITIFTDFIASHIVGTGRYTVIDRMQRRAILDEIEFSDADCTDEACQLEIGKLLSASQIIVGSLGKFGAKYILNIKLIEVETGTSLAASSKIYNSLDDLLENSQSLALSLLGVEADALVAVKEPPPAAASASAEKPPEVPVPDINKIPRASIRINGNFSDWANVPPRMEDPVGDKRLVPAMGGVDIEKVLLAMDDRYLYVSFVLADGNLNWNATYDFLILVDASIEIHLQTYYDQWQKRWIAHLGKWERKEARWTELASVLLWTKEKLFEARYPLSSIHRYVPAGKRYYCWANVGTQASGKWTDMDSTARAYLLF